MAPVAVITAAVGGEKACFLAGRCCVDRYRYCCRRETVYHLSPWHLDSAFCGYATAAFVSAAPATNGASGEPVTLAERGAKVYRCGMFSVLLWLLLFVFCWPLAILALVLWPLVWLLTIPFRILGIGVEAVFELLRAILFLPARLLGGRRNY
jgi:hypothetical protein